MSSEIDMRDEQLEKIFEKARNLLDNFDKSTNQPQDMKELQSLLKQFETAFDNFKIELRQLNKKDQREYKKKRKDHGDRYQELSNDIQWKQAQTTKDALMDGRSAGPDKSTEEGLINHGLGVLEESKDSLQRTLAKVQETQVIGRETANKLEQQTKQIEEMDKELDNMESTLKASVKIMRRMARKVVTDKYIMVLAFLVLVAILFIIIWASTHKK